MCTLHAKYNLKYKMKLEILEIDTVTNPYQKFVAILCSKMNLSYLTNMIGQCKKEPEGQSTKIKNGNVSV